MTVSSSTIGGVNTWTFSGAVTDAQIQTAWASLIVNGVYVINRAIYLDQTCDLTSVTGGFLVDHGTAVLPAFILDTRRDKTKSTFKNFTFLQRTGLIVSARVGFVQTWNGTSFVNQGAGLGTDGLSLKGGGFVYGVVGNSGSGGDTRFLNEMPFTGLEGATIYSQEFTEQELQIVIASSNTLKGITFEKAYGFPQIGTPAGNVNVVVYRSNQNTQSVTAGGLIPIRLFPSNNRYASVCYVDSYVTRNNADINTRLIDTFGANASNVATIMILNNYTRESWFGASKTNIPVTTWAATNIIYGGVLKKLKFVNGENATIKCYDSRSTTASQKCSFAETGFIDFLNPSLSPTTDANGQITLVHIGAIAQGTGAPITRYTDQKYTFQKFGYRVMVTSVDMTQGGDNDLSAFTPITVISQSGISRAPIEIASSATINTFQELLENIHLLAIGLTGEQSYNAAFGGNLFTYDGSVLTTSFVTVNIDPAAASRISFDSVTNTLTIKSSALMDDAAVTRWNNSTGTVNLLNGAVIQGIYQTSEGTSTIWEFGSAGEPILSGTSLVIYNNTGSTKYFNAVASSGTYRYYIAPQSSGETYTYAIEKYGTRRESGTFPSNAGGLLFYVPSYAEDVGITQTNLATVQAYTTLSDTAQIYDATANFRLTESGIKLGQIVARDGTFLDFGSFNVKIKDDASSIVDVTGGTITYKSIIINESEKYNAMKATPPKTITPTDSEQINVLIEDANGDSQINILGGASPFSIYKFNISTTAFPVGITPDTRTDVGNFVTSIMDRTYRFLYDPTYNYFVYSPSIRSDSNIPNVVDGQTEWEIISKGSYSAPLYKGNQIQLASDAPQLVQTNDKLDELILKIDTNLDAKVSTRLADEDYVAPDNDTISAIHTIVDGLPTLLDIEGSDSLAMTSQLRIINEGVKLASLLIPHDEDL